MTTETPGWLREGSELAGTAPTLPSVLSRRASANRPRVDPDVVQKSPDAWWTVLVVDPIALRVLPFLVGKHRVTPDRLSIASLCLALAAGALFLIGHLALGAICFE